MNISPLGKACLVVVLSVVSLMARDLRPGNWRDMVYHERLKKIVMVNGGPEQGKPAADPLELWEWNGKRWNILSGDNDGPRWRNFASVAYDSKRGVLILYGGLQSLSVQFEETWEWDGKKWTRFDVKGPGQRESSGMTYDAKRDQTILFGGTQGETMMPDTWAWNGNKWTRVAETGPPPRFPAGFVYDPDREVVTLFGGHRFTSAGAETFGDTWTWNGKSWTLLKPTMSPAPRDGGRAVFDTRKKQIVLFGGVEIAASVKYFGDTWVWNGTTWSETKAVGPFGRVHSALGYDAARDRVVLFGGSRKMGELLNDTWEWDRRKWSCIHRCTEVNK